MTKTVANYHHRITKNKMIWIFVFFVNDEGSFSFFGSLVKKFCESENWRNSSFLKVILEVLESFIGKSVIYLFGLENKVIQLSLSKFVNLEIYWISLIYWIIELKSEKLFSIQIENKSKDNLSIQILN